jgi:branched-chain amino acid transport system substrate-binding protein
MRRASAALIAVTLVAAACGTEDEPGAPVRALGPAAPVASPNCGAIIYGGRGQPQLLIVTSTGLQGIYKGHGVQTIQAMKMILGGRGWRAGDYTVGMQACEETSAETEAPSPEKCAANARAFAENPRVIGMIGPLTSNCAVHMLAILNQARGGPLATISGGNTYVGLTRGGPGTADGEPEKHSPTGRRGYARLAPTDDVQGAASALMALRLGAKRAFVVEHDDQYGLGLAAAYRAAAEQVGLEVAGSARWDEEDASHRELGEQARAAGADTVFFAGDVAADGPKVIADVTAGAGPDVLYMAGDSFNLAEPLVEAAGSRVEGLRISIAVFPNRVLPPEGRRFAAAFEKRYSQRPCCFSVHDAQGTTMLLDAIAGSGANRARVAERIMRSRVNGSLIGDFAIDSNGDTTLNAMAFYRIHRGKLRFETTITPPQEVLGRDG